MSDKFTTAIEAEQNYARTENGAKVYETSGKTLVDMYFKSEGLRTAHENKISKSVGRAYADDKLNTLKLIFHLRDIRGGQGLRYYFRTAIKHIAILNPEVVDKNLELFAEYGRWDDLIALMNTPVEKDMLDLIDLQLNKDLIDKHPSLLAKWLPSVGTNNKESKQWLHAILNHLKMSKAEFRKTYLSPIRKKINIIETDICSKSYTGIDYSKLPSKAMLRYKPLFFKYDKERFIAYIESLKKNKETKDPNVKINAGAVYPYEIIEKLFNVYGNNEAQEYDLLNEMWNALPNYIEGSSKAIPIIDVSASMNGKPLDVALSLGIYMAERNEGIFKDKFFTFSEKPKLVTIKGETLYEKVNNICKADWNMNTNFSLVFEKILDTAIKHNLTQDDMPERIITISDMQFDDARSNYYSYDQDRNSETPYLTEAIKNKYAEHGYKLPKMIFWNVEQTPHKGNIPMIENELGVGLVAGCSPSIFKSVITGDFIQPIELIMDILNKERYDAVTI